MFGVFKDFFIVDLIVIVSFYFYINVRFKIVEVFFNFLIVYSEVGYVDEFVVRFVFKDFCCRS